MKCREYIFKLSSGQLEDMPEENTFYKKLEVFQHLVFCHHCRAFTNNHKKTNRILKAYKNHLLNKKD